MCERERRVCPFVHSIARLSMSRFTHYVVPMRHTLFLVLFHLRAYVYILCLPLHKMLPCPLPLSYAQTHTHTNGSIQALQCETRRKALTMRSVGVSIASDFDSCLYTCSQLLLLLVHRTYLGWINTQERPQTATKNDCLLFY